MGDITKGGTIGGGRILNHVGNNRSGGTEYIDWNFVQQYLYIPFVKGFIVVLLLAIAALIILRLLNINSVFKAKGLRSEVDNMREIRKRDEQILRINRFMRYITNIVQGSIFNISGRYKDYIEYNLKRADLKVPGGFRSITAEEFNAVEKISRLVLLIIGVVTIVVANKTIGIMLLTFAVASGGLFRMYVRSLVNKKDLEIKENFADMYLMLHYTLIRGGKVPIDRLLRSYAKTTDSEEVLRFVENCSGNIETYGEYSATALIAKDYREIPEVGKLMRLIRQLHDGADVQNDLEAFRVELLKAREYLITKKRDALILKARLSLKVLMIILGQAIVTAMALYLPDMNIFSSLL